jgi:hypothetical protein
MAAGTSELAAVAFAQPSIGTDRGCYLVGQTVHLNGVGFAPSRSYVVTLDGVYLGSSTTDTQGGFAIPVHPGGLPAGTAQHLDKIRVTDGTSSASSVFTVTRPAGARIATSSGSTPQSLHASFHVWGFSLIGSPQPVYVHYIRPSGREQARRFLGTTGGQCGFINTPSRRLFPFHVTPGRWTIQVDTQQAYTHHSDGPAIRIGVTIA